MAKKPFKKIAEAKRAKADPWRKLGELIASYVDAAIADSWKGGGDPADYEVIEARFKLAHLELQSHLEKLQREYA